ncbi:MAG: WD40 repeat domain-containing protein [Candidatus Poribacteria bacterium]|nr:WD40 repeat domain-containing protein [Candidatus Poribacteria bacterium]
MKTKHPFFIILLLIITMYSSSFARDNTQAGLPEGAIARLGKGGINIMRFTPDGTRLVVGTDVGVWLYDMEDEKETALYTGQIGQAHALAFSQDGNALASGGSGSSIIQIWDLDTDTKLTSIRLTQIQDSVVALTFYGSTLISLDRRGQIFYWNVGTGDQLSESGKVVQFDAVTFSEDGRLFAIGTNDSKIHLWDATSGKLQRTLIGHANLFRKQDKEIHALAFSPDGKILASGSEDKTVRLWDTQNYKKLATLRGHEGWITALAFSKDGKTLASGDASRVIKVWDIETKKVQASLTGHKNTINALTFAPESLSSFSGCLASGSADGTIRFWDPDTAEELITLTTGHNEWVKSVAFSENDTTLATAFFNGTVEIWSLMSLQEITTFTDGHSDTTWATALSPDAKYFASQGSSGMIAFRSIGSGAHINSGDKDNLKVWEITTGREFPVPLQPLGPITAAPAFSPDKNIIASNDRQGIRIWQIDTGIELFQLHTKGPLFRGQLIFSPDGKRFAALRSHHKPQVWDVATQNDITPPTPPDMEPAQVVAFSPDGVTLATASSHGINLWNLNADKEDAHTKLPGRLWGLNQVLTFSPDGTILVGSDGLILNLIDVETGDVIGNLTGHTEPIETLVFSHNGETLATGSMDGTVLLWDWEKIISKARGKKGN